MSTTDMFDDVNDVSMVNKPLHECRNIPDVVKPMLDAETVSVGYLTGLNHIILAHRKNFTNFMLIAGAQVEGTSIFVPNVPNEPLPRTQIAIDWAINLNDLDIFFGRLNGSLGVPEA